MALNHLRENGASFSFGFASQFLGAPVTEDGHRAGRIKDLLARRGGMYPQVEGAVVRKKGKDYFLPIEEILGDAPVRGGRVSVNPAGLREMAPLGKDQFFVRSVLMDKQIVDVQGAKVERVNDVHLLTVQNRTYLVHVDVGFSGLLRRLGFEGGVRTLVRLFGHDLKDDFISWRHVQTLAEGQGPGAIRLAVDQASIKDLHPGELADILEDLNKDDRIALFHTMDTETAANALEEVEPELGAAIVQDLDPTVAADIIEEMEPSAAMDILEELPEEHQDVIMEQMEHEERREIELLQTYEESTAGALMTTDFLSRTKDGAAADALALIRGQGDEIEMIQYVYLVDAENHLIGVVSLRTLVMSDPGTPLEELMTSRLVFVNPEDDWEKVADDFYKYNFQALPVLDESGRLLGIVTYKHSFDQLVPYYYRQAS